MDKSIFYNNGILNKNKLKESWVKKNIDEYELILKYGKDITYTKFSQLLYHYVNQIPHNIKCEYCKSINQNFIGFDTGYTSGCSRSCNIQLTRPGSNETRRINTIAKYGVEHTSKLDFVKDKAKKTNYKRYGGNSPSNNILILNKISETNLKKYGVKSPLQSKDIISKYRQTCIEKYGVDNYSKTADFKDKLKNDGVYLIGSENIKNKIKETKYNKNLNIFREKYNIDGYKLISYSPYIFKFWCENCKEEFEISSSLAYQRVFKHKIELCLIHNKHNNRQSNSEREIIEYLKSIGVKDIENSNRKLLGSGFEIDIFIPSIRLGIELNGLYWHSDKYKNKDYHRNKYIMSLNKNIELIQIWEDDWVYKQDIIKSIILNKVGKSNKLMARKCEIKEISMIETKRFLNNNHIQGWCVSKFNIGLFYNNELVSLMTFGKMRINLGSKPKDNEYELLRFCNKLNLSVIGGSSKLFSYFIEKYNPSKIVSFSENDLFTGDLYNKLGMSLVSETISNYFWTDGIRKYNRFNFRKDKLIKEGFDANKTGDDIMTERGFFKIWNSGNKKYEWSHLDSNQAPTDYESVALT